MNNCYLGDGTVHLGDHLLFIHELCKLFKCAGISSSQVKMKLFSLSLNGRDEEWYRLLKDGPSIAWEEIVPLFYSKFYPPNEIHKDHNRIYNCWPHDGESIAQAWGRLKLLMLKCPIHELPSNIIIDNFYARLALHDKDLLDASCFGSFTHMKGEAKWDLLDRIQENAEGWENDKGRRSGINYDYECIKLLWEPMTFIMLALFMVLILRYLLTVLRPLLLILMFQRKIGTSIMRLIKILLVILLLKLLKFVLLIAFCLNLILRKCLSLLR
jgi:hypothetical protein